MIAQTHFQAENLDKILKFLLEQNQQRTFFERIKTFVLKEISVYEFEILVEILHTNQDFVKIKKIDGRPPTILLNQSGFMSVTDLTKQFLNEGGFVRQFNLEIAQEKELLNKEKLKVRGTKNQIWFNRISIIIIILSFFLAIYQNWPELLKAIQNN